MNACKHVILYGITRKTVIKDSFKIQLGLFHWTFDIDEDHKMLTTCSNYSRIAILDKIYVVQINLTENTTYFIQ